MAYLKPQSPIKNGDDHVYPLTMADQVILSDGSRLEKNGVVEAGKLSEGKTIKLSGDVTGSASFDGSENVTITTSVPAISELEDAIDGLTYSDVGAASASHTHTGMYTTSNLTFSLSGTTLTITKS